MGVRSFSETRTVHWVNETTVNGQVTDSSPAYATYTRSVNVTRSDSNGPTWKKKLKASPVLTGALIASSTVSVGKPAAYSHTIKVDGVNGAVVTSSGKYNFPRQSEGSIPPNVDESARNECIRQVVNAYLGHTRAIQGLVVLGEMRETLGMMRSIAGKTFNFVRRHTHKVQRKIASARTPKAIQRIVSEQWLQYNFGIRPLVSDAQAIADYYNKTNTEKKQFEVIFGNSKVDYQPRPPSITIGNYPYGRRRQTVAVWTNSIRYKMRTAAIIAAGPGPGAQTQLALGLTPQDFVPAMWELIPYSFIADYFSNVGDILNAWSYGSAFPEGLQQTRVTTRSCKSVTSHNNLDVTPGYAILGSSCEATPVFHKTTTVNRGRLPSLPVPTFTLSEDLGGNQLLNLAALTRTRFFKSR